MDGRPLDDGARGRLARLLADDRIDAATLLARLEDWGTLEKCPAFGAALDHLFHIEIGEAEARELVMRLLSHRDRLRAVLGRDPGLRVAGIDFFTNVEARLHNPVVLEGDDWERTSRSAREDPLTGLKNREVFLRTLVTEIRRAERYGSPLSMLLLDLDGFKEVNDRYGHLLGDLVLQRFGELLRNSVRESDVACRYGGEEFVVVLPETDRLGAFDVGERIRGRVERIFESEPVEGVKLRLTLSGGVACYSEDGETATELLSRADAALYDAKGAGKNRVSIRHPERRGAVRYPARGATSVLVSAPGGSGTWRARPVNVSRTGILVEGEPTVPAAGPVELRFDAMDGAPFPRGSVVRGSVVRAEPAGGSASRVGVAFDGPLPDAVRSRIAAARRGPRAEDAA